MAHGLFRELSVLLGRRLLMVDSEARARRSMNSRSFPNGGTLVMDRVSIQIWSLNRVLAESIR